MNRTMKPRGSINILIADDHDLVRTGIRHMLSEASDVKVIAETDSGEEAIKLARELQPHIILMDLKMPGIGGLEATKKILHFCPEIKILIVTAVNDNIHPARLLEVGAAGYLTKDATMEEMLHAIRNVHAGQRYISPKIAQQLVLRKISDQEKSPLEELSGRELQITLMILKGCRVQEIADKLNLSPKTVNSYRYRIFDKLGIKGDVELILLAIQHGLLEV